MKVKDFLNRLSGYVPCNLALSFDNVGLLVGDENRYINGIYISLDINNEIIDNLINNDINTVITHHPMIFNPIKSVTNKNVVGKKIMRCIQNNINVISCHTNLDAVASGMNDKLVDVLEFKYNRLDILDVSSVNSGCGIGRIVYLESEIDILHIICKIKSVFGISTLRFIDSGKRKARKICVINGSGNSMIRDCYYKDIDLVITGDITYHTAFDALDNGVSIIDMGHFNSENFVYMEVMKEFLKSIIDDDINVYYDSLLKDVYKYV